ncbi:MAG TPA: hypothetical protein VIK72_12265 [Clostridiaceae bacterium]
MDFLLFKDTIDKIEGVMNSKIVSEGNALKEIHILASNTRSAKQIVRDVETAIITIYDYKVDRKIISIAQIDSDYDEKLKRIKYEGITLTIKDNTAECTVTLIYDEEIYVVTQSGIRTTSNSRRLIADTTLKVVEKILGQTTLFDIQEVIIQSSGDIQFTVVLVNMLLQGNEETVVGSAIIKNDTNEAITKATLGAINRRVQKSSF